MHASSTLFSRRLKSCLMLLAAASVVGACKPSPESPAPRAEEQVEAPVEAPAGEDVDPTTEVVSGEGLSVTLGEVEKAVDRLRIFAPRAEDGAFARADERWFRTPQAQSSLVNNLLHFKVMRMKAQELELSISPADEIAMLESQEQMQPFLPLFQENDQSEALRAHLSAAGLSVEDVRHLLHDMIYAQKVHDALIERFDDEKLWKIYEAANDTATVVAVRGTNTPTSREIDEAVSTMASEIEAYYRDNPLRYMRPQTAKLTVLRPKSGENPEAVQEAARRLKSGEEPEAIAAGLGLELRPEAFLILPENPKIFEEGAEDVGFAISGPRGQYAYRVLERIEPTPMELNRPLRREIASHLMRTRGIVPSARQRLQPALALLNEVPTGKALSPAQIEGLITALENAGFEAVHSEPFSVKGTGYIPGLGLAEELAQAAAERTLDEPTLDEPLKSRDDIFVFRLVDRQHPSREAFAQDKESFRESFMAHNGHRLSQQLVNATREERNIIMNLQAVSRRYPLMSKDELAAFASEQAAAHQAAPSPSAAEAQASNPTGK
ncbi:hypothetical protein DL240_10355 [Lujinxingia litoralis]|uniref:PpiC domain-containing protein n=1 Tax=Lujinxingia litoralis TaxID=2211119 RepID=A0A328C5F7_9DELT|nr:peptidylprolyl isomerase [Lujinxingia litoralis]RAL22246.1 hypothetical protein DL240_10355 [Lujinxingia litoralis]